MTSTSNLLLNCPYGSINFPDILICGTYVQMGWCQKIAKVSKFIVAIVIGYDETDKPLSLYLVFTGFNTNTVLDFALLVHAWTDLKFILLDFLCRKGIPFRNNKSMASSTFWWWFATRGGKVILGMVLWYYGLLIIALPYIMGIWGP